MSTTLLGDWLTRLESHSTQARVGWVSLDEGDDDPTRLLTHLAAACAGPASSACGSGPPAGTQSH